MVIDTAAKSEYASGHREPRTKVRDTLIIERDLKTERGGYTVTKALAPSSGLSIFPVLQFVRKTMLENELREQRAEGSRTVRERLGFFGGRARISASLLKMHPPTTTTTWGARAFLPRAHQDSPPSTLFLILKSK